MLFVFVVVLRVLSAQLDCCFAFLQPIAMAAMKLKEIPLVRVADIDAEFKDVGKFATVSKCFFLRVFIFLNFLCFGVCTNRLLL